MAAAAVAAAGPPPPARAAATAAADPPPPPARAAASRSAAAISCVRACAAACVRAGGCAVEAAGGTAVRRARNPGPGVSVMGTRRVLRMLPSPCAWSLPHGGAKGRPAAAVARVWAPCRSEALECGMRVRYCGLYWSDVLV